MIRSYLLVAIVRCCLRCTGRAESPVLPAPSVLNRLSTIVSRRGAAAEARFLFCFPSFCFERGAIRSRLESRETPAHVTTGGPIKQSRRLVILAPPIDHVLPETFHSNSLYVPPSNLNAIQLPLLLLELSVEHSHSRV